MAGRYSYGPLPAIHVSQDIAEYAASQTTSHVRAILGILGTQPPSFPSSSSSPPLGYSSLDQRDNVEIASLRNIDASHSPTSTGIEKLKNGWNRMRRKRMDEPWYDSIRRYPAADIEPARIGRGVWKDQLLVDRSLRSMATLMTVFAVAMFIVVATQLSAFYNRANKASTSVGGRTQSCKDVTHANTALLLLINLAATMILGMSNTYQQLVTALKPSDLKHMLQTVGDSRVGTNSPFNINHKPKGKVKAWSAWLFLICTSLPVHFLANSVIGPSYVVSPPPTVQLNATGAIPPASKSLEKGSVEVRSGFSFTCWSAFRTGHMHYPKSRDLLQMDDPTFENYGINYEGTVKYDEDDVSSSIVFTFSAEGNCSMGRDVICELHDPVPGRCRLNVRMSAAFILAGCLILKAVYMISINVLARGKLKRNLLTFGDVIVASASNPELRVQGECMVNANDSVRRLYAHTCHKHCKSKEESKSGDDIGHCQKCKSKNSVNRFADLAQPTITTKLKKSLISNLGSTALIQMCLLMFCSTILLGVSIFIAVLVGWEFEVLRQTCREGAPEGEPLCKQASTDQFAMLSGGFGGFGQSQTVTMLPPDKITNELISIVVSNGAQFIYSLLYLMMIYNITLISQEYDWGKLEHERKRLRCTTVKGGCFSQDYLLQLPKKILFPTMAYSVLTHWMLGEALQTQEAIWIDNGGDYHVEHSKYIITYAAYPLWIATFLILLMTGVCWWAFTYRREGFIPQMFGSIRTLCASTTRLDDFPAEGVKWGDLGMGKQFRHAGLSADEVEKIWPNELYAGLGEEARESRDT